MKKFFTLALVIMTAVFGAMAQDNYKSVKGYVVDKNGNPIPGAEVIATGGGESVITDADGSFSMNVHPLLKKMTANYSGMQSKTLKTKFGTDMIFTLKPEKKHPGFLSAITGGAFANGYGGPMLGLMGGQLGKWGYYGKAYIEFFEGETSVTAGVIKSLYKSKSYIYLGLGYGLYADYEVDYDDDGLGDVYGGLAIDFGFIFRPHRHINIPIGYTCVTDFDGVGHAVQIGIGYVF